MEILSDKKKIERFTNGDSDAFDSLVNVWQNRILSLACRYMGNMQDAKDVCQNTLIKVYNNLGKLKNKESFSVWIYKITVNLCKDELKKRKKRMNLIISIPDNESFMKTPAASNPKYAENVINSDIGEIIKNAVNSLPDEQRIVVILKEYQNLKFREISKILKISENTAKSRMYYALKNIRKSLERQYLDKEVH